MKSPGATRSGANRPSAVGPGEENSERSPIAVVRSIASPAASVQRFLVTNEPTAIAFGHDAGKATRSSGLASSLKRVSSGASTIQASTRAASPVKRKRQVPTMGG